MMTIFEREETLAISLQEAWSLFADWDNAPNWMPEVESVTPQSSQTAEGTRLEIIARGKVMDSRVVVWKPGERAILRSEQGKMRAEYEYSFEPVDDGRTRVRLRAVGRASGWLRILQPIIFRSIEKVDGVSLQRFKSFAEATD